MGLLYGMYGGRSDGFQPGGASFENGFTPHGGTYSPNSIFDVETPVLMRGISASIVSYDEWEKATQHELEPRRVAEGTVAFMFESSFMFTVTDWAMHRSGKLHGELPSLRTMFTRGADNFHDRARTCDVGWVEGQVLGPCG